MCTFVSSVRTTFERLGLKVSGILICLVLLSYFLPPPYNAIWLLASLCLTTLVLTLLATYEFSRERFWPALGYGAGVLFCAAAAVYVRMTFF